MHLQGRQSVDPLGTVCTGRDHGTDANHISLKLSSRRFQSRQDLVNSLANCQFIQRSMQRSQNKLGMIPSHAQLRSRTCQSSSAKATSQLAALDRHKNMEVTSWMESTSDPCLLQALIVEFTSGCNRKVVLRMPGYLSPSHGGGICNSESMQLLQQYQSLTPTSGTTTRIDSLA